MKNLFAIIIIILILLFLIYSIFKVKKKAKAAFVISSVILLVIVIYTWFHPSWEFPKTSGIFNIASVSCTYIDNNRIETYEEDGSNRWLNVKFWYPENYTGENHTCPLILFSHGAFGIKESNETLYRELASNGYVVCAIDHTYQCLSTKNTDGKEVRMSSVYRKQVIMASDSDANKREELYQFFSEWMEIRMGDINFVLDTIISYANSNDNSTNGVYMLTDTTKIGVMGHSLGGSAALGIGRIRSDVKAIIALEAPFMFDVKGIKDGNFIWDNTEYPIPLLNVYTDSSWNNLKNSTQYEKNYQILNDNKSTTYDLYVKNAGHMTLTDLAFSMPPLCLMFGQNMFLDVEKCMQILNQNYLDFFNYYLKEFNYNNEDGLVSMR